MLDIVLKNNVIVNIEDRIAVMSKVINNIYYENINLCEGENKFSDSMDMLWLEESIFNKYNTLCKLVDNSESDDSIYLKFSEYSIKTQFKILNLCNFLDTEVLITKIDNFIKKDINEKGIINTLEKYKINNELDKDLQDQINYMSEISVSE